MTSGGVTKEKKGKTGTGKYWSFQHGKRADQLETFREGGKKNSSNKSPQQHFKKDHEGTGTRNIRKKSKPHTVRPTQEEKRKPRGPKKGQESRLRHRPKGPIKEKGKCVRQVNGQQRIEKGDGEKQEPRETYHQTRREEGTNKKRNNRAGHSRK